MINGKRKKRLIIIALLVLCSCLVVCFTFAKYAGEWDLGFGLLLSPTDKTDTTAERRYFRSNELLPASKGAEYTVNGTSTWFTVSNSLDSNTMSEARVDYTLTWYVSDDGTQWTEHKKESASFVANQYKVEKYTVAPVTSGDVVYNHVKVVGKATSFTHESIEATYNFVYADYTVSTTYADGIVKVTLHTNDVTDGYKFTWVAGITPDNSDPNTIFASAATGPSEMAGVTLKGHTVYEFLFFVTDAGQLGGTAPENAVSVTRN